jgi:Fe-S-cluster-containing hydrogenase component 2
MANIWQQALRPHEERRQKQKGKLKELLLGAYAPREPQLMDAIHRFLEKEDRYPLSLIHRILDRLASMTICTTVVTHQEILEYIDSMPDEFAIAKGPCACRIHTAESLGPDARDLASGNLDLHRQSPLNVDIQIGLSGETFGSLDTYEFITKRELIELENECRNMGLVSNIYMMVGGEAAICHCSSPTCIPLTANRAIRGKTTVIKKGRQIARTDMAKCDRSGNCVKVCHFNARSMTASKGLHVDHSKCFGCGLCADVCPSGAVFMVKRNSRNNIRGKEVGEPANTRST